MATIKYKHNGEWKQLQVPLTVVRQTKGNVEYVAITANGKEQQVITDLTPYISDLAQIELMEWFEAYESTYDDNKEGYHFLYCPQYNAAHRKNVTYKAIESPGYGSKCYFYGINDSSSPYFTIGGTPEAIKLIYKTGPDDTGIRFNGTLHIYYRREE